MFCDKTQECKLWPLHGGVYYNSSDMNAVR